MTPLELQSSSSGPDEVKQIDMKGDIDFVESTGNSTPATYAESLAGNLSKTHRDYLMERHGTLELDPMPGMSPADPYNWPEWKVSQ